MNSIEQYIAGKLDEAWDAAIAERTCVRDGVVALGGFDGDPMWCPMCGLHPKELGPAREVVKVGLRGLR